MNRTNHAIRPDNLNLTGETNEDRERNFGVLMKRLCEIDAKHNVCQNLSTPSACVQGEAHAPNERMSR